MRLTPSQRRLIGDAIDRGINKTDIACVFGISRSTVYKWDKRRRMLKDKKRRQKGKITLEIELSIVAMRAMFEWGTARIQQGLFLLPEFMQKVFVNPVVQGVKLSRTAINNVLRKHKMNGYKNPSKGWKFFRASIPNELWQLDTKGPFRVNGKKYYFVICIDDYSRFLIVAEQLDHCPDIEEIEAVIGPYVDSQRPQKILTDNNPFKEHWDNWCKGKGIEPLHAHPYYPQDKGKVERTIRNVSEEFVYLTRKFPTWLRGKISDYKDWFNKDRFHRGINCMPAQLYSVQLGG